MDIENLTLKQIKESDRHVFNDAVADLIGALRRIENLWHDDSELGSPWKAPDLPGLCDHAERWLALQQEVTALHTPALVDVRQVNDTYVVTAFNSCGAELESTSECDADTLDEVIDNVRHRYPGVRHTDPMTWG